MGKFFQRQSGVVGCCVTDDDELRYLPNNPAATADFDESVPENAAIVAEFHAGPSRFTFVAGQLQRDGVAVSFAAESVERMTRRESKDQLNDRLTEVQAVIDGVDASTNAQLRTMVKTLARNQKRILRILKGLI